MTRLLAILLAIGAIATTACNFRPLPKLTDPGDDEATADAAVGDATDDAPSGPVAMQCTSKTILGGMARACVLQDSAGQFTASLDISRLTKNTVSVQLLACNPDCSKVQIGGALVTGSAQLVTRPKDGLHGYLYKASFSIDTNGPPTTGFESGVIVYP